MATLPDNLTDLVELAYQVNDVESIRLIERLTSHPLYTFQPRPDNPQEFDEQSGFVNSDAKFSILLGGTGAGKTEAAAYRTAWYLLNTKPPRKRTPFWVIGETYDLTCAVCWEEKLSKYIPDEDILDIDYYKEKRNWPRAVILQPWEDGTSWVIEFKSYAQGRSHMQARSIGGFWFNEACPLPIVEEVRGRCRDYNSPGWADFTPIDIREPEWIDHYEEPPEGWKFFHVNTSKNTALADGWFDEWISSVPEDLKDTRTIGVFGNFRGAVFKEFRRSVHVIEESDLADADYYGGQWTELDKPPTHWRRIRGIDFGYSNPFACVWVAVDGEGRYFVYDVHYQREQTIAHHAKQIHRRWWPNNHPSIGLTYADWDAQQRRELHQHEIFTQPAKKDVAEGVRVLRSLMLPRSDGWPQIFITANCEELINEIRKYHYPPGTGKGDRERNPLEVPVDKDDHCIDAMRYAIYSDARRAQAKPTAKKREWKPREAVRLTRPDTGGKFFPKR